MSSITIKNIPKPIHDALKQKAIQNGRSLNREILYSLSALLNSEKREIDAELNEFRNHRNLLPGRLTDELLDQSRSDRR